jgi:ATP-binding cassette, subfamily C, bacterial PrsD
MQAFGPKEQVLAQVLQPRIAGPTPVKIVPDVGAAKS